MNEIPGWLTQGRTVLLPKAEDLNNERNYRTITCLNTCYKIFTGKTGNYMKSIQKEITSGTEANWELVLEFWEL